MEAAASIIATAAGNILIQRLLRTRRVLRAAAPRRRDAAAQSKNDSPAVLSPGPSAGLRRISSLVPRSAMSLAGGGVPPKGVKGRRLHRRRRGLADIVAVSCPEGGAPPVL